MRSNPERRGLYIAAGSVEVEGSTFEAGRLLVFGSGAADRFQAVVNAGRGPMLLGGRARSANAFNRVETSFPSSRAQKIEQAQGPTGREGAA